MPTYRFDTEQTAVQERNRLRQSHPGRRFDVWHDAKQGWLLYVPHGITVDGHEPHYAASSVAAASDAEPPILKDLQRWEYAEFYFERGGGKRRTVFFSNGDAWEPIRDTTEEYLRTLARLGAEGWEMIQAHASQGFMLAGSMVFKRPLPRGRLPDYLGERSSRES